MGLGYVALVLLSIAVMSHASSPYCNGTGDSKLIATVFATCHPIRDGSNCPAEKWLELFKNSDMQKGSKSGYKIINVGFNKGYNFAEWLNVFTPNMKIDIRTWHSALQNIPGLTQVCGACNDCTTPPVVSPHLGQPDPYMHIVGVDLNKGNIFTVNSVMATLNKTHDMSRFKLEMIHAAGGSPSTLPGATNTLKIPRCPSGNEMCKIPDDPSQLDPNQQYDIVPLVSMDGLVHDMHILKSLHDGSGDKHQSGSDENPHHKHHAADVIDILHIDTEGNDAEVIKSTTQLLKSHRIRALIFEYHFFLPWGHTKLSEVSAAITSHDMECYMCGQDRLWPISDTCWDEQYEFHQWSNVICILRSDPWYHAVAPLVQTVDKVQKLYPEGTLLQFEGQREIFLIENGKRRGFSNWNAFASRGYSIDKVVKSNQGCANELYPVGELLM